MSTGKPFMGSRALETIYFITSFGLIAAGLGFVLGPAKWRSSDAYSVTRDIAPLMVWAVVMILVGCFKLGAYYARSTTGVRVGAALGGTVALMWALALIAAAVNGKLLGWGAVPAWLTVAAVQLAGAAEWKH